MLYTFLLTLMIVDGLVLGAVVLLQAGQGGGLASLGGGTTDLVMGGRQAVTILHKASWITGGLFMFLAVLLSIVASRGALGETEGQRRLRQPAAPRRRPAGGRGPRRRGSPRPRPPSPPPPPARPNPPVRRPPRFRSPR